MFQTVDINIVPTGEMPVVNVSQYDVNRVICFCLLNDGETYTPTNFLKAEFIIRKVDGTLFTQETTILVSNLLELVTTEQMTACAGKNIGEIRLTFNDPDIAEDDVIISTLNFILDVERSPETGGIESESEIANLNGQIASIVDEQLENYYTKSEIDSQIEEIVSEQVTPIVAGIVAEQVPPAVQAELGNYYTKDETDTYFYNKTETDTLLSGKADVSDLPDMSDYYTKTDTDTLLAGKVSTSTLNDYYTKTQVDNLISSVSTDFTTSIDTQAAVQTFTDGGDNIPLKSCMVNIPADGTGFSEVNIFVSNKNFSKITEPSTTGDVNFTMNDDGTISANGTIPSAGNRYVNVGHFILSPGTYTMSGIPDSLIDDVSRKAGIALCKDAYSGSVNIIKTLFSNVNPIDSFTLTEVTDCYLRIYVYYAAGTLSNVIFSPQVEKGEFATSFVKHTGNNYTIALGETLTQGGTLEAVSGLLTRSDTTTSHLTGENILTLSGLNNIYADCGDINALEYFNNKAEDIAALITLMNRS